MGGLCGVGHKQTDAEVVNNRNRRPNSDYNTESINNKVQEEKKEKFNDFEEYKSNIFIILRWKTNRRRYKTNPIL
jgi:hypothetical protein